MTLSVEEQRLLPSDEDVAFYREHGWYISKKILSDDIVDEAMAGSRRHFAGERDVPLRVSSGYSDWRPGDGDGVRNCEYVTLQNCQVRKLVERPILGAIAAKLCGSRAVRLFDDQLIYKPPAAHDATSVVGWHSDRAYWMTCTSDDMLTAWIPFHDCPEQMGPLVVIDGSHKWPVSAAIRTFNENNFDELEERLGMDRAPLRKVPMILSKGRVSFHNCLTIHGSDINRSDSPRISLAVHMQDAANRYRVYRNDKGIPWRLVNDQLCRLAADGTPDYTDPQVFPLLWSD
jgi:ectoine hydroxylase-related dioxygenase (phytanoyl-CoA dioxygenase family)